jgi:uncharacterized protein
MTSHWRRGRLLRLFGFDYRIEVFAAVPARARVLRAALHLDDELVARLDLKADRRASVLRVAAAHFEPGADRIEVAAAAAVELDAMRSWLGLDDVAIAPRGDLAPAL